MDGRNGRVDPYQNGNFVNGSFIPKFECLCLSGVAEVGWFQ
jgi:hypothetical protein